MILYFLYNVIHSIYGFRIIIIIMRKFREKNNANNFWTDRNSER